MIDEIETYLSISPNKFEIYLFDKKNLLNTYKEKIEINSNKGEIDYNVLIHFPQFLHRHFDYLPTQDPLYYHLVLSTDYTKSF